HPSRGFSYPHADPFCSVPDRRVSFGVIQSCLFLGIAADDSQMRIGFKGDLPIRFIYGCCVTALWPKDFVVDPVAFQERKECFFTAKKSIDISVLIHLKS